MKPNLPSQKAILIFLLLFVINKNNAFAQSNLRPITELTADTSAWQILEQITKTASNKFEILPIDRTRAKEALYQIQVTTHSLMGAVIYFTGGILIDDGWIRILGSGSNKIDRTLPQWNKGKTFNEYGERPKFLLIADDAIGGFFAINGGALGNNMGNIYYLAPDGLKWEDLEMGYTDFINFCFSGDLNKFYETFRWKGWQNDVAKISGTQGFFFYPYLWTVEGQNIGNDKRSIVPIDEIYTFETNAIKQISH